MRGRRSASSPHPAARTASGRPRFPDPPTGPHVPSRGDAGDVGECSGEAPASLPTQHHGIMTKAIFLVRVYVYFKGISLKDWEVWGLLEWTELKYKRGVPCGAEGLHLACLPTSHRGTAGHQRAGTRLHRLSPERGSFCFFWSPSHSHAPDTGFSHQEVLGELETG